MYDGKSANSPFNDSSSPSAGCPVPEAMEVRSSISRGPMYVHSILLILIGLLMMVWFYLDPNKLDEDFFLGN